MDAGTGITISVHTSLCCSCINNYGTEEQKQKYLRPLVDGSKVGCFGLTEANAGSDVQGAQTVAVKDGDEWVIKDPRFLTQIPALPTPALYLLLRTAPFPLPRG